MVELQILYGTLMILITVIFHIVCLVVFGNVVSQLNAKRRIEGSNFRAINLLSLTVFVLIIVHVVEASCWAFVYMYVGEFQEFSQALYFSVVTATTLGYGDTTLTESWQLLGTFEAIGGLLLFGASTAGLFQIMTRVLPDPFDTQ